jgi:hypothetical protein
MCRDGVKIRQWRDEIEVDITINKYAPNVNDEQLIRMLADNRSTSDQVTQLQ